jgi:lipopolysaccharide transport system ATP-binding protein
MSDPAISTISLGKIFRVWRHPSDILKEALTGRRRHSEFEALRDVSFNVPKGSVVGVMGRNGAGKSTLLRIIAGTLDATSGTVSVAGRVSAILELGTGFHPEYSGRENVFLGGLCLGLTRAEVASRLDEIVAFAELQEFIDQPFRTYSSGMQARLTFAVATAVDPDILIIDEALAVGDARFALKSFDRVRQFRRHGKSILLVSHNINHVVSICDHAVLLEKGRIIAQGEPSLVGNIYHELLFGPQVNTTEQLPAFDGAVAAPASLINDSNLPASTVVQDFGLPSSAQRMDADVNAVSASSRCNEMRTAEVIDSAHSDPFASDGLSSKATGREHRYGDGAVRIVSFFIRGENGSRVSNIRSLRPYEFVIHLHAMRDASRLGVGVLVRTPRGIEVFGANTFLLPELPTYDMTEGDWVHVRVPFIANLGHGTYFASAVVANSDSVKHDARFDALEFTVEQTPYHNESLTNLNAQFIYERPVDIQSNTRDRAGTNTP